MRVECWTGVDDLTSYLRRVVGPRCRDENDVDDVVQEACIRVARYRRGLSDEALLRPWAARIALNVLASRGGRRARPDPVAIGEALHLAAPELDEEPPGDFLTVGHWRIERDAALAVLRASIAELDSEDRRLLVAFYGAGESCRHAARVCETTPVLAKVRLFRTRKRLARIVRRRVALRAWAWVGPDGVEHEVGPLFQDVDVGGHGATLLRRAESARRPGDRLGAVAQEPPTPRRSAAS